MIPDFAAYEAEMLRAGFDEVLVRHWPPGYAMGEHAHAYAVKALVVQGDLWVKGARKLQRCAVGESFELDAGELHSEASGALGATFWVAKREPAAG